MHKSSEPLNIDVLLWFMTNLTFKPECGISIRYVYFIATGDARMDSPGHCAMYATYTMMDEATGRIMAIKCIDKREVDGKSPNMEPEGLRRILQNLQGVGITILEVVTDAHVQIPPILSKCGQHKHR